MNNPIDDAGHLPSSIFHLPSFVGEWAGLLALMAGYAALFAAYYPPLSAIEDESGFVNQALVWSRGSISAEGAGLRPDLADFGEAKGRHVGTRHPGRSLLALPFLAIGGVRATFASGLLLHLAMAGIGGGLLVRLGRSPAWAALLLLHPTLALYSRTIMADAAAGTGLLLAALAVTMPTAAGAVGAGLAVALAAAMRHHAGLALPLVAAAVACWPGRAHPRRDAALCLLAGAIGGAGLIAYNVILYGTLIDPFTAQRGYFSAREFLVPHTLFYASALMLVWPAMLPAPALDRSPLRWLIRGVCVFYFLTAALYYFHDQGKNAIETAILGQRLLQVALPLWIISYAGVVDDRVAVPLRRRLGARVWGALAASACVALLAGDGLIFRKHQEHLIDFIKLRDAMVAAAPDGSLVIDDGPLHKLFDIPAGLPSYRWRLLLFRDVTLVRPGDEGLEREARPWFLTMHQPSPGDPLPAAATALVEAYRMERLPSSDPHLALFVARPGGRRR